MDCFTANFGKGRQLKEMHYEEYSIIISEDSDYLKVLGAIQLNSRLWIRGELLSTFFDTRYALEKTMTTFLEFLEKILTIDCETSTDSCLKLSTDN